MRSVALIAEDDDCIRELFAMQLGNAGFSVLTASDGREALSLLGRHPVEAVLTDDRMPTMTGLELLRQARANRVNAGFVLISGYLNLVRDDAVALGFSGMLSKPCESRELVDAMKDAAARNQRRSPRVKVDTPVQFGSVSGPGAGCRTNGRLINVSSQGVFVAAERYLPVAGAQVVIEFHDRKRTWACVGNVAWVRSHHRPEAPSGFGLSFDMDSSASSKDFLSAVLEYKPS